MVKDDSSKKALALIKAARKKHATQLRSLTINSVREVDLSPLGELSGLRNLEVTGDGKTKVEFLRNLTGLETLHSQGPVEDWGPLSGLTELRQLDLQSDDQSDIIPLAALAQLERLSLTDGDVTESR